MPILNNFTRALRLTACFALFNMSVPGGAVVLVGTPIRDAVANAMKPKLTPKRAVSRELTQKEQDGLQGATGQCPYIAGQNKFDVMYRGVDLISGNYSTSVTDMSFDGGYGIPVNITRSYSANDGSEEPFGIGWTLSADVRTTAGGILKSSKAPIRSVPVNVQEKNTQETDPNVSTQPASGQTLTDAAGKEETIQRDIDGILSTPPWDNNVVSTQYTWMSLNGTSWYEVATGETVVTLDGTTYQYTAEGSYPSGTLPWNAAYIQPAPTPQPSNVLKVTSVTDRQGNVTHYNYGSNLLSFQKVDGQTSEHPLTGVTMPNGHLITLVWGNGTSTPANRIVSVNDGAGGRVVNYAYNGNHQLYQVTTPGGRITTYGYGTAAVPQGWQEDDATNLLTSITDPRGMETTINYTMAAVYASPYQVVVGEGVWVTSLGLPNGNPVTFTFQISSGDTTAVFVEGPAATPYNAGQLYAELTGNPSELEVAMQLPLVVPPGHPPNHLPPLTTNYWAKYYDPSSQNLLEEVDYVYPTINASNGEATHELAGYGLTWDEYVTTTSTYNFAGNVLSKSVDEHTDYTSGSSYDFDYETQYGYWDQTKYYQQKIVKDQGGRYSYTDYYTNAAAAGSRGQQYQVFDNAHGGFYVNNNITVPPYASGFAWKYNVVPTAGQYTAQFNYDSAGRCTDVYKLRTTSPSWTLVHTNTVYGGNGAPTWGQATGVTEDVGGIGRYTQTNAYTAWGKADDVTDAAGHEFVTAYDLDGLVQTVTQVDHGLHQAIVTYGYGTSGISNGQPTSITDGLTGVEDAITYDPSSGYGGYGQVFQVQETGGPNPAYTVQYAYAQNDQRSNASYSVGGTSVGMWGYYNWAQVGPPEADKLAFTTLNKLNSNGTRSSEEFHYAYDNASRLSGAAFAQTPQTGQTGYDTDPALRRARAYYDLDPAGRVLGVQHYWDVWNGSGYTSTPIIDNECAYEETGLSRGLKTSSSFYVAGTLNHTETFGYDPSLDYLTSAAYGSDGVGNPNQSWTYDPAGNRNDVTTDNLNRATVVDGLSATNDILGNRKTLGSSTSYGWDSLNRLTTLVNGTSNAYSYRADGMRVGKTVGSASTVYRYDGQMGFEDVDTSGSAVTTTDYGIGGRGIDYITRNASGTVTTGFPIYDCHGNMTACLFRSGTSYTTGNQRSYDAWGNIRQGLATGDPKGRYCAALGHKMDDESGLIYMRARYYEPASGRFINEDPGRNGSNWFVFADDNPVGKTDATGRGALDWLYFVAGMALALIALFSGEYAVAAGGAALAAGVLVKALFDGSALAFKDTIIDAETMKIIQMLNQIDNSPAALAADASLAGPAVEAENFEDGEIEAFFVDEDLDAWENEGGGLG